jgi:hypothetical protein
MKKTSVIEKHRFPTTQDAIKLHAKYLELLDKMHLNKRQFAKHVSDANFNKELHMQLYTNMTKFAVVDNSLEIVVNSKLFSDTNLLKLLIDYDTYDTSLLSKSDKLAVYQLKSAQATMLSEEYSKYSYFVIRKSSIKRQQWSIHGIILEDFVDEDTGEVVTISRLHKVCSFNEDSITFYLLYRPVKKTRLLLKMFSRIVT